MSYEEMRRQARALQREIEDRVNETIYHYTSAEGFRGIVTSSELWLTNAAFVNDTTECKAFLEDCAKDLIQDESLGNNDVKETLGFRLEDGPENDKYYIASFSRARDSLSQYRAYGKFCIGLDPRKMRRNGFHMYRCVYRTRDINDWVRKKARVRQWNGDCLQADDRCGVAGDLVFAASVKYKNAAYRDEREIRMVAVSGGSPGPYTRIMAPLTAQDSAKDICAHEPPIHFRDCCGHGMATPYVKFFFSSRKPEEDTWEDIQRETVAQVKERKLREEEKMPRELLPITEVWIGPMAQQEEVRLASEIMLREKGYENVQIIASQIPYRGR